MKNHIIFKFIAILLCAAALLGAAACGAGVAVLTGLDLYDQTVDEAYRQQLQERGSWFAQEAAGRYSDVALGGMPTEFLEQKYGFNEYFNHWYTYYEILDAEGNSLPIDESIARITGWAHPQQAPDDVTTYTFPVAAGKYQYLVSAVPDSQKNVTEPVETAPTELGVPVDSEAALPAETQETITLQAPEEEGAAALSDGEVPAEGGEPQGEPSEDPEALGEEMSAQETLPEELPAEGAETAPVEVPAEAADAAPVEGPAEGGEPVQDAGEPEAAPEQEASAEEPVDEIAAEKTGEESAAETAPLEEIVPPTEAPTEPEETIDVMSIYDISEETEPVLVNGKPLSEYQLYTDDYYDSQLDERVTITYVLLDSPSYIVKLHLQPGAMEEDAFLPMLRILRAYRSVLLPGLAICLLVFAALAVYLCCAAGRKPKSDEVRASGLNRIPLELYVGAVFMAAAIAVWIYIEAGEYLLHQNMSVAVACFGGLAYAVCLLFVGFCFAVAAQVKTPGWFWLKNSLCGICVRLVIWVWHLLLKSIVWLASLFEKKLLPFLGRILRGLWRGLKKVCGKIGSLAQRFLDLLPLTWQWLVTCLALLLLFLISIAAESVFLMILSIFASIAALIYGSHAFGVLLEATRRMSRGDLHAKINDNLLIGCFRDFAKTLNALASVAVVAAQKQLKSERMKTELITNVSHDIKTPLTSIISYADLLQKPHTPEEEAEYLEVLSRQSMQLKKLIEDLIEMSKASTGNMTVDITQVDAVEAVNQALGEFADKLDAALLTPVFRHSEDTAPMLADGKLVWRVLHNLLSNAVKYALPGTRLYIDMLCLEGKVILSMKNVSRDELNVDAEELMERFVRGDGSRNTEGSGLGLNIAKSMMELQHGSLQLLVDGDLFKVTLIFPGA